jgi:hypothetical protein
MGFLSASGVQLMPLDRLTIQMFKTLEGLHGTKSIIRMAKGANANAPADPKAALELARMAREYMLTVHHMVVVLDEGEILDEARMERYVREQEARERAELARAQERDLRIPPLTGGRKLGQTEWQKRKDEINRRNALPRETPKPQRPAGKSDGKVWVTLLDGQRFRVDPDMAELLRGTGKVMLDG